MVKQFLTTFGQFLLTDLKKMLQEKRFVTNEEVITAYFENKDELKS